MMKTSRSTTAFRLFGLLACLFISCENLSQGTTWYVDNAGPGGDGTSWASAWGSFAAIGWDNIRPGDTIQISGGAGRKLYHEMLTVGKAGAEGRNIVIRTGRDEGHNGTVIIDGGRQRLHGILLQDYVTISGEIDGKRRMLLRNSLASGIQAVEADGNIVTYVEITSCGAPGAPGGFAHGIRFGRADNGCEVSYCHIHHNFQDGYSAEGSEGGAYGKTKIHHNVIEHNSDDGIQCRSGHDIHDNVIGNMWQHPGGGQGHPDGIQAQGDFTRIWNNRVYNCHTQGIFVDPLRVGTASHLEVYNNEIYRTAEFAAAGYHMMGISVKAERGTDSIAGMLIANNTIVDMGYMAIGIFSPHTKNISIVNNIVYNCRMDSPGGFVIGSREHSEGVVIDHNLVNPGTGGGNVIMWNGKRMSHLDFTTKKLGQKHGQTGAPRFVSYRPLAAGNDLHLAGNDEAASGKGKCLSTSFAADKDGKHRWRWDIGCYVSPLIGK